MRSQSPVLLNRLNNIPDPRNPEKSKHKLTVILIYGILTFIYQMASRRVANRTMTRPIFMKNLMLLFPELETVPHNDTLMRLLSRID
ncbi:transposase family protein [Desulfococcaceae bacterium HSG9]|nr:transposase family protein [Desulfococcaceae bacterium HSG9]